MTTKLTRRSMLGTAALAGASLALPAIPARAEGVDLVLSSWLPPRHPIVVDAIKPWAKDIEAATEGRVRIRVLAKPLGSPPAHFDMARDGVADITYGLHSFTQDDRFKNSRVGQFSFLGNDAVSMSEAFWTVYTEKLGAKEEHAGTHLLGLFNHGPGMIHNNKRPINKIEDLQGLKMRVPGGYIADLMSHFGVETIFTPSGEVYEKLSRGVVDGVTFPYDAIASFNLADYLKYTTTIPGGIYNTTWFLVMNSGKWDSISPTDQEAINKLSGLAFASRVGKAWNGADERGKKAAADGGMVAETAPQGVLDAIKEQAAVLEGQWADSLGGDYDGRAALEEFRKQTGVSA
ncbi:TRAP transporter substrate-binding protein [Thioclava sp. F28-4]|uniref:TRAP transporter substrate-binding protein n=1 Tax=Thioclava sp. F28-4 TaxID=1915315 RepID=UPI0009C5D180|nr:TRAP transporter substrate-binding protein [Thioclava sp. F28-4]OOY04614.1 ABC transporter substrate-binding protein [Thioclava sp. F28-4]